MLTQWRLENESNLVDLMTLKLNNVPEELFHSYCKIILTSLVLIPQYILDHEHEKRFLVGVNGFCIVTVAHTI